MKAIILAGGYATRLQPLTDDLSKCLLPVGGKPMVDWILERIRGGRGDRRGARRHEQPLRPVTSSTGRWSKDDVTVHDDGTSSNDDRLGAIGDVAFTLDRAGIVDDDVIVIAGDNLFDYDLQDYIDFWRGKGVASAVAVRDVGDLRLASQYGIVDLDGDDRVIEFVEKPPEPTSTLAATATYIYHREHCRWSRAISPRATRPTSPGASSSGCARASRSTATRSPGCWLDIGDKEQLLAADNMLRRAQGLPERDEYELEI